jgi:hypothetical protein
VTINDLISDTHRGLGAAPVWAAAAAGVAALLVLAIVVRRVRKTGDLAHRLTLLANLVGLGWSAQGMWDTAVHHYHVPRVLAFVLFFLGEVLIVSRMLMAHRYRDDRPRRARFIRAVWLIAAAMGVIVALGEGLAQAPLRLAVPLGVAYAWWLDLTADDDPTERLETSWRWTPRRLGLSLGLLEPGARDAKTIDRANLVKRLTDLTFAQRWGSARVGTLTRRRIRMGRLLLVADDDMIRESVARVARAAVVMEPETHPTPVPQPNAPVSVPTPEPTPDREPKPAPPENTPRRPQSGSVRVVDGRELVGEDLKRHAIRRMVLSVTQARPNGMTTEELRNSYEPPLGQRTAEGWAADARRAARTAEDLTRSLNGHVPEGVQVP